MRTMQIIACINASSAESHESYTVDHLNEQIPNWKEVLERAMKDLKIRERREGRFSSASS